MVISAFGFAGLLYSLILTRRTTNVAIAATKDTDKALEIAVRNADAAAQAAAAREVGQAQVRCHLHVTDVTINLGEDTYPCIGITAKNSGRSPAIKFTWRPSLLYSIARPDSLIERNSERIEPNSDELGNDIAAGGVLEPKVAMFGFFANRQEMDAISTDRGLVLGVDILMTWKDVFGNESRATKGFMRQVQNDALGISYRMFPMGDSASLTQRELYERHLERERAKQDAEGSGQLTQPEVRLLHNTVPTGLLARPRPDRGLLVEAQGPAANRVGAKPRRASGRPRPRAGHGHRRGCARLVPSRRLPSSQLTRRPL